MYLDFISQNYVHSRTRERSTIKILESGEKQKTKIGSQPPLSNIIYPEDILSSNQPFIQSMKNVTPSIYPSERKSNQPLSVYRYYFLEKAINYNHLDGLLPPFLLLLLLLISSTLFCISIIE